MLDVIWASKKWFLLSWTLILISIMSFVYNYFTHWTFLKYWIDFTWWTMMEIQFDKEIKKSEIDNFNTTSYKDYGAITQDIWWKSFIIRSKDLNDTMHKDYIKALQDKFWQLTERTFTTVWPTVWEQMKTNALFAIFIAVVAIIVFIAFSFSNLPDELNSWYFGLSAVLALIHDVVITVWVFSIMWIFYWVEIDTLFITAILTVLWFSVHDTIVVFDRIRENVWKRLAWDNFAKIGNIAVNQTLWRSINTSFSAILPLIFLYLFGSPSVSIFLLALIIWITVWTYSSIFLATPFLIAISSKDELTPRSKIHAR